MTEKQKFFEAHAIECPKCATIFYDAGDQTASCPVCDHTAEVERRSMAKPTDRRCGTCAHGVPVGDFDQVHCGALPMISDPTNARMLFGKDGQRCALWRLRGAE